jgi:hypothetical protein
MPSLIRFLAAALRCRRRFLASTRLTAPLLLLPVLMPPFKAAMALLRRSRSASNSAMMATLSTILLSDPAAVIVDERGPRVLDSPSIIGIPFLATS